MRAYAIGDIHGYLHKLERAHVLIEADRAEVEDDDAPVVHIGDLTDRGPDSKGVIDFLIKGLAQGEPWVVIKGNHDRMMSWYLEATPRRDHCLRSDYDWAHQRLGGMETMASYGVNIGAGRTPDQIHQDARAKVPQAHLDFLSRLENFYQLDDLFFCHAGIRPGISLAYQSEDDLLWIRQAFHIDPTDHGALIIHGHTPVDQVVHYGNRVNIDTGAGYGKDMSAVVIEGRDVWLLTDEGRRKIEVKRS